MKQIEPSSALRIANARPDLNAFGRISRGIRTLTLATAFLAIAAAGGPAFAQSADVYSVRGVAVDMTAETAAAAREKAISAGHVQAFNRLIARIVPEGQRAGLPVPALKDVEPLVRSFGIDSEKRSSVRYLGTLTFQFRRADVRKYLQSNGVGFAETRSKPVLLLPLYEVAGARLLWDDPNPWFEAWNNVPPSDGLVPVRLPVGDLADVRDISAEQAAAGNADQLALIAERYGASAVLIAEAAVAVDPASGQRSLNVSTRYFGGTSDGRTAVRSFQYAGGETDAAVIGRAAVQIAKQVEEDWKRENLIRFENLNSLIAEIALTDLRQWVEIRRRLQQVAFLQRWQLVALSRRDAEIRLTYYGDAEQLRIALAQRDLLLEQGAVNWSLRESRGPSPARTTPETETPEPKDASETPEPGAAAPGSAVENEAGSTGGAPAR